MVAVISPLGGAMIVHVNDVSINLNLVTGHLSPKGVVDLTLGIGAVPDFLISHSK